MFITRMEHPLSTRKYSFTNVIHKNTMESLGSMIPKDSNYITVNVGAVVEPNYPQADLGCLEHRTYQEAWDLAA